MGHALPQSMELNESQTRALFINPQLLAARWKLDDRSLVRFEIPVDGYDVQPWNGVTDYCLYDFAAHRYNADQIRFLRSVPEVFLAKRRLTEADLDDPPLTIFGRNAVERFFAPAEIKEIVTLTDRLAA